MLIHLCIVYGCIQAILVNCGAVTDAESAKPKVIII